MIVAKFGDSYYCTVCINWKVAAIDLWNTNMGLITQYIIVLINFEYKVLFSLLGVSLSPNVSDVCSYFNSHMCENVHIQKSVLL